MIKIKNWCQISRGKLSPAVTNLNNFIITNPTNPSWRWVTASGKLMAANDPIPYIYSTYIL